MNTYTQEMIKRVTEQSKFDDVKYAKEDEAKAKIEIQTLKTSEVFGNPNQPRQTFQSKALEELAASIKQEGQQQPGEVIPVELIKDWNGLRDEKYMVISGESRLRACILAGINYKAIVVDQPMTMQQILLRALTENEVRSNPTPIENANVYKSLKKSGMTIEEIATKMGKRKSYIIARLDLLKLRPIYQKALEQKVITIGQANQISRLRESGQDTVIKLINSGKVKSYKDTINAVDAILQSEQQTGFALEVVEITKAEKSKINALEKAIISAKKMIEKAFNKNHEIVIVKKIGAHKADQIISDLELIKKHIQYLTDALTAELMKEQIRGI